jgi:hypothetical protein
MITPARPAPAATRGLRWLALATTVTFGCATVRVPASAIADPVPVHDGYPEPQVAIWVEDTNGVSPEESRRASEAARAAIVEAISGRTEYEGDAVLVVRAQGVTRTPARRKDQNLAIAGIVVGSVVVVAAVVAMVVAGKGKGGGGAAKAKAAPKPAAGAKVAAAAGSGVRVAPAPGRGMVPKPLSRHASRRPRVVVPSVGVWIDATGTPAPAPLPAPDRAEAPAREPASWDDDASDEDGSAEAPPVAEVSLAAPPELPLAQRGFFARDELLLELVLVDRHDGTPLWRKEVHAKVNPCDARAVRRVVDGALGSEGWMPADVLPE